MNYTAECITISSDEDEEDVQVLTVLKLKPRAVKNEQHNNNNSSEIKSNEGLDAKRVKPIPIKEKPSIPKEYKFIVPIIDLIDDCDDTDEEMVSEVKPKTEDRMDAVKLENGIESNSAKNKTEKPVVSVSKDPDKTDGTEDERPVTTEIIKKLIETCRKVEYGSEMQVVERKIWNYFNSASTAKTWSLEFKIFLENSISKIEALLNSTKDKLVISRIIKDVISEMKNDPHVITGKLKQLYTVYNKLIRKIGKLEETEVESDDDGGNPYIYLDRYRKKAVEVYNKICELEGRASDADRPTLQRFFFTSSTAPIPVQRALEKFYNKTRTFPDFYDVKKLVRKVNKKDNLSLSENDTHTIAQSVFLEFGERLVWRRKYDDYNILVDYLREGQCEDPAENDVILQKKLAENKKKRKKEQEVLDSYALREVTTKMNESKNEDSSKNPEAKCSSKSTNKDDTNINSMESLTINVCSSSSESESESTSIVSSPVQSDTEDDETEKESNDDEDDERLDKKKIQNTVLFSDSEEELNLDLPDKRKKVDNSGEQCTKRFKSDNESSSENDPTKANVNNVINRVENNL